MIFRKKSNNNSKSGSVFLCEECETPIGRAGDEVASLRLSIICGCGSLIKYECGTQIKTQGDIALLKKDMYICPECRRILFRIKRDNVRNVAFRARCACGRVYERCAEVSEKERHLGAFASLME